ncbi:MAG TPA: 4Fe-4S binding protein [Clostridia bacterium]|nr:4Fe-4S binding protein [Clostridia bacterium]
MKRLVILSGKGGTGKTTVAGALIGLSKAKAYADCDVDAPNLHLIISQKAEPKKTDFYGMQKAEISQDICTKCGLCKVKCRFDAIKNQNGKYFVDMFSCEGCGVCETFCPVNAIELHKNIAGELFLYHGNSVFSTAKLKMGSGTSGKLVTEVKKQLSQALNDEKLAIIDGSPGIGCPVIASLSGADAVLIVAEPSVSGISDMERIIHTAKHFGVKIAVCVNKYDTNEANTKRIEKFCKQNRLPFVGKIPYDINAQKAINQGKTIAEVDCSSGDAVKKIYNEIKKIIFEN